MGIFSSRPSEGTDEALVLWKVRLFVIGAALGVGGMVAEAPWVLWAGVGVLMMGLVLRFVDERRARGEPDGDADGSLVDLLE